MTETAALLHNMSVPPKSVVKYDGFAGSSGPAAAPATHYAIGCRAPAWKTAPTLDALVLTLGLEPHPDASTALRAAIERRASELPLPDGVLLVPYDVAHQCPWPDLLTLLVVVTKSTAHVWLRSKEPSLSRIATSRSVSLLVPASLQRHLSGERS